MMPANALTTVARDAETRRCFAHDLPEALFTSDALDEIGRYTRKDLRARKVYDVNWRLRGARLSPRGPGGRLDRLKCLTFDGISTATRRGLQYRGHV